MFQFSQVESFGGDHAGQGAAARPRQGFQFSQVESFGGDFVRQDLATALARFSSLKSSRLGETLPAARFMAVGTGFQFSQVESFGGDLASQYMGAAGGVFQFSQVESFGGD